HREAARASRIGADPAIEREGVLQRVEPAISERRDAAGKARRRAPRSGRVWRRVSAQQRHAPDLTGQATRREQAAPPPPGWGGGGGGGKPRAHEPVASPSLSLPASGGEDARAAGL